MLSLASVLATAVSAALSLLSSHHGLHHSFAYAVLASGNASRILNLLRQKADIAHWFLQIANFFRPAQVHLFLQAFSEASVSYLETLSLYLIPQHLIQQQVPHPHCKEH